MSVAALIVPFQILSLIGSALTAAKLLQTGLYHRYRWFFWYFLFRIPNSAWPLFIHNNKNGRAYFIVWVITEPLTWLFHTAVVLELYRLVLEKHKGLYTVGRWAMFAGVATSAALSLISLIPKMTKYMTEQSKWLFRYLGMERGVMLGLAILLLFLMGFLVLYAVPLSRNVKVHARIYTAFFFSNFLVFLLQSLRGLHVHPWTNLIANVASAVCAFGWFFLLSPEGEEVQASGTILGPEHERRILLQLDALNATLLKISKN